jgi:hypothetical protein
VTKIPFGAQITKKKNDSEFVFLNQLGGILGMTGKEIVGVHRSLAEQAFRKQAEVILADGQLTKAKVEQLNDLQKEVGLPEEYAQKVIRSITTTKMAAAIETAVTQGRLNIKQIRELKEAGVDLDNMVSKNMRELLFKKTVGDIFSSGTGEFDEEEVYENIPSDLNISKEKSRDVVRQLAQTRLSNSLIQAVALLRQRNRRGVVSGFLKLLFSKNLFVFKFCYGLSSVITSRLLCRFHHSMICWLVTKQCPHSHYHGNYQRSLLIFTPYS